MRIWVDFENTPHVLILKPIIEELQHRGHQVIMTARDCSQTIELAEFFGLTATRISHHHGKKTFNKILGHLSRILRLSLFIRKKDVAVAVSHGSRSQIIAAGIFRIPNFVLWDYEYASLSLINRFIDRLAVPEVLSPTAFSRKIDASKIITYPGIKEHIYAGNLLRNGKALNDLTLDENRVIITIRPPAVDAHYHQARYGGDELFFAAIDYFSHVPNTTVIVLPRTKSQQHEIIEFARRNGNSKNIIFPSKVQNGLSLIWHSDIVVSGGGTMNREAAVLNVPVYSIFRGKFGAVDRYLNRSGRLHIIRSKKDFEKIQIIKRQRPKQPPVEERKELVNFIVDQILAMNQAKSVSTGK